MEMLCECQHLPPTTENPIPCQNVCRDLVWEAGPHRAPCLQHLPLGRGPGHIILEPNMF